MKMRYFHQEGGGRTPGTLYAGSATGGSPDHVEFAQIQIGILQNNPHSEISRGT